MSNSKSPNESFFPADPVSEELLKSIPKKVYNWLDGMGTDMTQTGTYHELSWDFSEETSWLAYSGSEFDPITFWWEGDAHNPSSLCTDSKFFECVTDHIEFFTQLEEDIYSTLELFEEERDR
jgi:hypothetical protein